MQTTVAMRFEYKNQAPYETVIAIIESLYDAKVGFLCIIKVQLVDKFE